MRTTTPSSSGLRLGGKERRALFSLDRASSGSGEEDDDIELGGNMGEGEKSRIVEAFERLGIDVRTPEEMDDDDDDEGHFTKGGAEKGVDLGSV
jgi:hypothetical protein